ncbi:MAG: hypothetical protein HC785_17790 [Calothrix sp. CSU_2_0]|nr:hypothetical protein [Microcoleus sp. SM1_3_4]NJR17369.1 hypothetical protein [Calothrix sp. CSU_2_0]
MGSIAAVRRLGRGTTIALNYSIANYQSGNYQLSITNSNYQSGNYQLPITDPRDLPHVTEKGYTSVLPG